MISLACIYDTLCHCRRNDRDREDECDSGIIMFKRQNRGENVGFLTFYPKLLGTFSPSFTCLLYVSIYARLQFLFNYEVVPY